MSLSSTSLPRWAWLFPLVAWLILLAAFCLPTSTPVLLAVGLALGGVVFAAVHHAEVIAHRIGEPFGTLVLALAVTVIEVALIVSVMLSSGPEKAGLARDTVYAAIMIVCNGIVGICLLMGGWRHREQGFQIFGASAAMGVLTVLAVMTLVLPNFTRTLDGPMLTTSQLAFVGITSLVLYGVFVFIQTVRHRDYFLIAGVSDEGVHAAPPPTRTALLSLALLLACLVAVVLLAKLLSPSIEAAVARAGAPAAVVGIIIAALVLLPEGLAALRAARADRLQNSINLALGSALASIGLTIPTVAAVFIYTGQPLLLGLPPKEMVLLALTLLVGGMTLATGRTTIMQGTVHLVIFAAFLFLSIVP
jgi:Ca2+:H+ antiporter